MVRNDLRLKTDLHRASADLIIAYRLLVPAPSRVARERNRITTTGQLSYGHSSMQKTIGWILSGLLAAFLIGVSGIPKFIEWEGKAEMMDRLGWTLETIFRIGFVEIAVAVLFLIPRTAFVGAILVTGYLGGATATHVRIGDPFFMPVLLGVIAWIALGLRDPRIFRLASGRGA